MSQNKKTTSKKIASLAAEVLRDSNSSEAQKRLAASALSQRNSNNQTGGNMEDFASMVLKSKKYNDTTKTLAASVLSQSNKER